MSLSVSQGKKMTFITITSNPKSRCPILCHILSNLCYIPACLKPRTIYLPTALGIPQIIIGILNIIAGILFVSWGIHDHIMMWNDPFWFGGVFLISGIMATILPYRPGSARFLTAVILSELSWILAMIAAGKYLWDIMGTSYHSAYNNAAALIPEHRKDVDSFPYIKDFNVTAREFLDVVMIVFAVLQFCINLTYLYLTLRACVGKQVNAKTLHHYHNLHQNRQTY